MSFFYLLCTLIITQIQFCLLILIVGVSQSLSMKIMASLKSGVLVRFLEDMKMGGNPSEDDRKPNMVQIRSIIPVLEEGDHLWPNRGFYLKVSDISHALYVSLPEEQNEMILANKLKLGQFIYVQKLEDAHPFPLLRGVTPLPGRRPCVGTPQDIVSVSNFMKFLEASNSDCIVEKGVISENRIIPSNSRKLSRGLSDPEGLKKKYDALEGKSSKGNFRSLSASKLHPGEKAMALDCTPKRSDIERRNSHLFRELQKTRKRSFDIDSDTESILSSISFSSHNSKRKSWNESEILGIKEIFDSSVVKHDIRPPRSRSATVSPVRSVRYDSSDENSSSVPRRREVGSAKKMKSSTKSKACFSKTNSSLANDRRGAETGISWDSLPSSLVKLGKEVVKQRDIALVAATDALQEACAAERLLNSLSKFSEFHLAEEDDLQPHVDKFFDLQDDMAQTRLVLQSLTNISPLRTSGEADTNSVKEALTIAVERKKNASTWIKSAVALDLTPCSTALNPIHNSTMAVTNTSKKTSTSSRISTKPKGSYIIKSNRNSTDEIPFLLSSDKDEQPDQWTMGSTTPAATVLASSLQDECRKLFLGYVEKYLDEVERKASSMVLDSQIAGMMYKVKRVNDWLDVIINKEANAPKDGGNLDDSEIEICHRVRNKIYGILLKHVERTAMAFGSCNST
ncbi:uncharacterized protein LOC107816868 [Nicotiana tabacum]|uniref:Uncharacterized protein LOC107816868 n=2 Tax=Nicotiana tabacum TaxID=4097 RepID=A0A1S4CA21_TOBAC|nr:PREDICTED: uncharacterized protein LOC107816868 isoform X1 [Nicotiana tabacum]